MLDKMIGFFLHNMCNRPDSKENWCHSCPNKKIAPLPPQSDWKFTKHSLGQFHRQCLLFRVGIATNEANLITKIMIPLGTHYLAASQCLLIRVGMIIAIGGRKAKLTGCPRPLCGYDNDEGVGFMELTLNQHYHHHSLDMLLTKHQSYICPRTRMLHRDWRVTLQFLE